METGKYYNPELSEFHVGFEYEESPRGILDGDRTPIKIILNENHELSLIKIRVKMKNIRVKYLDVIDIKDKGFIEFGIKFGGELYIHTASGCSIYLPIRFKDPAKNKYCIGHAPIINGDGLNDKYVLFNGYVKNVSELNKILMQINMEL